MAFDSGSTLQQEDGVSVVAFSTSSSGGGGTGASTWGELSGKPSGLFASGGGSDGFAETEALAATDIATALSHSPGLADGIQTSIRASGSATDDALATEQAIREALNASGAEKLSDLSDVDSALQSDGNVLASGGAAYREEGISAVLQDHAQHSDLNGIGPDDHHAQDHDHTSADVSTVPNAGLVNDSVTVAGNSVALGSSTGVLAEDLSNVVAQNRSDGDTLVYDDPATQYVHLSISDLIKEFSDTGIFNDVLVGGVAVIRSDTEPTVAEWETELGRTLSNNEVPENVIWVDSSTSPSTTLAYDPEATSGFQQASYARSGYWIEYATGLLDAGLFTDGDIEADDIIAEGSITGNEIKSETTITIGTNTQFILDGINDRFYSTDYSAGTDGFEIDLKNSESQLPNLDVVGTLDADTWDQGLSEHTNVSVSAPADGDVLSHDGSGFGNEGIASVTEDHVGVGDLSDVANASQDGKIIADQGGTYGVEAVSTVTQDHVAAENLANVIAQNRSDGDLLAYIGSNSRYEHRSVNDAIQEFADTGIFNDVLVGGVASIRSDTEPTEADWDAELPGRSVPPVPDNVIWVDTDSSGTPTLTFYDSDATAGYQQASYAKGGYWVEKPTGLIDAGLITEGNVEATDIIAEGTITGNQIKSETTITIGTNRQFVIDGINDRFYSTNYNKGQAGIEIDLTNFESQLEGLTVIGELDAGVWDQSLSEHTDASVSSASDSDVLAHDGTQFVNESIAGLLADHAQIQDLGNVPAPSTDGQVIADQGGTYANEAISSLTESHVTLSDLDKVGITNKADGDVLVETGVGWGNEAISGVLGDHADWSAMQNVAVSSASSRQVAFYDTTASPPKWSPEHIADLIRDRGSLSIGDVSVAGSWRTIESNTEPTQRPNGDPLEDGDVWIDTDASPVAEAYVYRNGAFVKQATAIGGNNIVTDSVSADKVVTGTLTAQEVKAGTLTATEINTSDLFADSAAIDTLTSEQAFIDDIENITFTGQSATITRLLEVGTGTPRIQIDGTTNRIESTNFASLLSGFRIESDGRAEFADIRARGAIKSAVFEVDEQTIRGGTDIVAPATTLAQDASGGDTTIEVQTARFETGDDIRFKEGGTTEVRTVSAISGTTITLRNALANAWSKGAAIVRWNDARIINTADSADAPFTSYVSSQGEEVVRIGNLDGLSGLSGSGISIGGQAFVYNSDSGTLNLDSGSIGDFTFAGSDLKNGQLAIDGSKPAIFFESEIHPDLTLAFGQFDRDTLPDVTDVTSNLLSSPDFTSGWQNDWSLPPASTEDFANFDRERVGPVTEFDLSGDDEIYDPDDDGLAEGVITNYKRPSTLEGLTFDTRGELRINNNIFVTTNWSVTELPSAWRFEFSEQDLDPVDSTKVAVPLKPESKGFSDTSNDPSSAARFEIERYQPQNSYIPLNIEQDLDVAGDAGEDYTLKVTGSTFVESSTYSGFIVGSDVQFYITLYDPTNDETITETLAKEGSDPGNTEPFSYRLSFEVPPSEDVRLILDVVKMVQGYEDRDPDTQGLRSWVQFEDVTIKTQAFNSVIASDGMLWRDTNNNETMSFDTKTGQLKADKIEATNELTVPNKFGLFGTTPASQKTLSSNVGGTTDGTLESMQDSALNTQAIRNNFQELYEALSHYGLV